MDHQRTNRESSERVAKRGLKGYLVGVFSEVLGIIGFVITYLIADRLGLDSAFVVAIIAGFAIFCISAALLARFVNRKES